MPNLDPTDRFLEPGGTFSSTDCDGDVEGDGHLLVLHQPHVHGLLPGLLVLLNAVDLQVVKVHITSAAIAE